MGPILDGLSVAASHGRLVAGILIVLVASQLLLFWVLRKLFEEKWSSREYYSLSLTGWLLPAMFLSLIWYAGTAILSLPIHLFAVAIVLLPVGMAVSAWTLKGISTASRATVLSFIFLTVFFLILRLAFVSRAAVPLYFDSAQHYRFINEILLSIDDPGAVLGAPANYYHLGFHLIAAFLTFLTGADIADTMLVLGQVILAVMPFSLYFPVTHVTRSSNAGIFAIILAAFGWYMPAHAMDWGKYPALASLALLPFVLNAAYLVIQQKDVRSGRTSWALYTLLLAGAVVTVFLHSRSLVVFGIAALAWGITSIWKKLGKWLRLSLLALIIAGLVAEVLLIRTQGILGPLLDAYAREAVLITGCVLFLSIFAFHRYPGVAFFCLLSTALLLASLFIPLVGLIPGYAATTLLDRPFVQMILYLPLTLLGAVGLAGLEQWLGNRKILRGRFQSAPVVYPALVFITLVVVHALFQYDLYPSDCCDIASEDDLAAIQWMDQNLPADALILTSSTELKVLPTDEFQGSAGSDAGAWITPLIGRMSTTLPFHTDFSQRPTLDSLCQMGVDYVYVGKTGYFFDDTGMPVQPDGYRIVLALPKARVYEVTGCG